MQLKDFIVCILAFVLFFAAMCHSLVADNSANGVFLFALPTMVVAFGTGYGLSKHIHIKGKWDDWEE